LPTLASRRRNFCENCELGCRNFLRSFAFIKRVRADLIVMLEK
jgi:hypothetical protein